MATKKKARVNLPAPTEQDTEPRVPAIKPERKMPVRYLVNGIYVDAWGKPIQDEEEEASTGDEQSQ